MAHSNQVREFLLTDRGIQLRDVYVGPGTVLTGSARLVQEAQDRAEADARQQATDRRHREIEQERAALQAQLEALRLKSTALSEELQSLESEEASHQAARTREQEELGRARDIKIKRQ